MKQFKSIKLPKIRRNKFDLSHEKRLTADMFYLYPVLLDDCIPGDKWKIGNEIVIRTNPLAAPLMHEINCYVHYYYVPYRILWDDWEKFITGGTDGKFTAQIPKINMAMAKHAGSLWDYFGFNVIDDVHNDISFAPLGFPLSAYNMIYNNFYRDQNIQDEVSLSSLPPGKDNLYVRAFEKDYFTSMLPWQQRGIAPSLPISGKLDLRQGIAEFFSRMGSGIPDYPIGLKIRNAGDGNYGELVNGYDQDILNQYLNNNKVNGYVDMKDATTFDVSEIRFAVSVQRFLERSARSGSRYTEFLKANFPAYPRDDRLDRPEYIGGSKTPIIISEVLQTSRSEKGQSPQGYMAGHGLSADRTFVSNYNVQEHGLIMGIMSIMPRTMYTQGIDRVWMKSTRYDYYFDEFAHLSEQAVYVEEMFNYNPKPIDRVIGYQGRYDEYRYKRNTVHGLFRTDFEYWHMARKFRTHPTLNLDLIRPNEQEMLQMKRVLAVPEEPMFLISFGNKCHVTRPMPFMAQPGLTGV
jgi:hypothetical protein